MEKMKINHTLFTGRIDRDLRVQFSFDINKPNEKYPTILHPAQDKWSIVPSFGLFITTGYNTYVFIPGKLYYQFIALLRRSVASISEHLYEIFPNADSPDFEVNTKALEIYSTRNALSTAGMKIVPCVWNNQGGDMYPGLSFVSDKNSQISIPLEDAIPMVEMLSSFDPHNMMMQMIHVFYTE